MQNFLGSNNGHFFFNNSAFIIENKGYSTLILECIETIKKEEKEASITTIAQRIEGKEEALVYIPINAKPSIDHEKVSIKWYLEFFKGKSQIDKKEIIIKNYPIIDGINHLEHIEKFGIKLIKNKENIVYTKYQDKLLEAKLIMKNFINGRNEEKVFDLFFSQDNSKIFLKVHPQIPNTYVALYSSCRAKLLLRFSSSEIVTDAEIYDFSLDDFLKSFSGLEGLIMRYLAKHGPMTLGSLVALIARNERLRLKSAETKKSCILLHEKGLISKNEKDWNTATYYLNSLISSKIAQG